VDFVATVGSDTDPAAAAVATGKRVRHFVGGRGRAAWALERQSSGIQNDTTIDKNIKKETGHVFGTTSDREGERTDAASRPSVAIGRDRRSADFLPAVVSDADPAAALAQVEPPHQQTLRDLVCSRGRTGCGLENHSAGVEDDISIEEQVEEETWHTQSTMLVGDGGLPSPG
jgi:hypothetical protein